MFKVADIESPYNGKNTEEIRRNILYARIACRWALNNKFYPYASHLFFTQPHILDDELQEDRKLGIEAGKHIIESVAEVSIFFKDFGMSEGMKYGKRDAESKGREIREERLFHFGGNEIGYEELYKAALEKELVREEWRKGWEIKI